MWFFSNPNKVLDELYQQAMSLLEAHFLYSIVIKELEELPIVHQGLKSGFGIDMNLAQSIFLDFTKLHLIAFRDEAFKESDVEGLTNDIIIPEVVKRFKAPKNSPDYIGLTLFPSLYGAWFNKLMKLDNFYILNAEKKLKSNRLRASIKILKDCKRPSQKKVYDATEYITINVSAVSDLIEKGLIRNRII